MARPSRRHHALLSIALILVCAHSATITFAQAPEPKMTKAEERAKFHSVQVTGTKAAVKEAAYQKRLNLEQESFFGGIKWRNVGPEIQSGRVVNISVAKNDPKSFLVGYATGGLYKTEDDGQTFTSLFDNQSSFGIGDVAVSKDGKTIWVGTGEHNSQRTSYAGTGIFKSTDGGKTWTNMGLPESHHIGSIVIDPKDENTVWVAVLGHLYSEDENCGVYKTTDGGKTWKNILKTGKYTGAMDLVLDPRNSNIAMVSMWDRSRRAWNFLESGPNSAVHRTTDGGKTWSMVKSLPQGDAAGRVGLAQAASKPDVVYAFVDNQSEDPEWLTDDEYVISGRLTPKRFLQFTEAIFLEIDKKVLEPFWKANAPDTFKLEDALAQVKDKKLTMAEIFDKFRTKNPSAFSADIVNAELWKSEDGGKSFTRVTKFGSHGGYYWGKVFVNPRDHNDVWTCGVELLRSRDGGKTWAEAGGDTHVDYHFVHFDANDPKKIVIGCDGGAYLTYNDGKNWRALNTLSVGQTTTVAVSQGDAPYAIYTGLQDNGTLRGSSDYVPGQDPLTDWKAISGGDGSHIAVDPRPELDLVYTAAQFGAHMAIEQKTGKRYGAAARAPRGETPFRYNWISPLIISPHIPDIVYLGSQKLHRSFDRGRTWQAISGDLTRNLPNGDVPHSTIKDISESPLRFGLIYVGADDGRMTMTPDGGYQWVDINTPTPTKWISRVVASRHDVGTVYVSQNGYREDDFSAYLWKSTDFGKTWKSVVGNLPDESINVVREDPKNKDILYVGTDMGVYVSFDGGKTYETLHGELGHLPVHDMVIQEKEYELVIATHARGIYILPLKKVMAITPELRKTELKVTALESVKRQPNWGIQRRQKWDSTQPQSPFVTVEFFSGKTGAATVDLLDKDGKVVKSLKLDAVKGFNAAKLELVLKPGDLNAPRAEKPANAADALKDPYASRRPTYLAVGTYTVKVTVGGQSVTTELKVTE